MKEKNLKNSLDYPLVSIIVITYNSSKYVLETLESAKAQTYQNIELIISDDSSTDDTVKVCQEWLRLNHFAFNRTQVIIAPENSGIPGNCNQGLNHSQGKWIKIIAGDDILLPGCISSYMNFLKKKECYFLFSFPEIILEKGTEEARLKNENIFQGSDFFSYKNAQSQFLHLLTQGLPMSASTFFFNKEEIQKVGGFDNRYLQEDRPLYLKLTYLDYKLEIMPMQVVKYRIHSSNMSTRNKKPTPVNEFWFRKKHEVAKEYLNLNLLKKHPLIFFEYYNRFFVNILTIKLGNKDKIYRLVRKLRWFSPLFLKRYKF